MSPVLCIRISTITGLKRMVASIATASSVFVAVASANTATSLNSFEGIEEPLVRYTPATHTFKPDSYVNIVDVGGGTFRMALRYTSEVWDADRDTPNTDRQRAEAKGLGPHQKTGETFEYATTWRSNGSFQGASRFCHIFQLKSTDGDSGAPVVTLSILPGRDRVAVQYWSGPMKSSVSAREFPWKPGEWQSVRIRITISTTETGSVTVSVNGDPFEGAQNIPVYRTGATDYRPKWGLYRAVMPGLPLGDDYVEHKAISASKVGGEYEVDAKPLEAAAKREGGGSVAKAFAWLAAQPASPARNEALATIAAEWAQSDPDAAMAFANKLPAEDNRHAAIQRVFNRWGDQNPTAALRWASTQKSSAELDDLLWYYATDTTYRYVTRQLALEGAALIGDSALRGRALEHVVLIWARRDPADADHYVQTSAALTPEQKAALRGKIAESAKRKAAE